MELRDATKEDIEKFNKHWQNHDGMSFHLPKQSNLIIYGLMGGTLKIPLKQGEEHAEKAKEFISKLLEIPEAKELFLAYGAEFTPTP